MEIDDFITNYLNETGDPLKNNPNRDYIRGHINNELEKLLKEFKEIDDQPMEMKRDILGKMYKLLSFKYGPYNHSAEFNKIYVGKIASGINYLDILPSVDSAIRDK